MSSRPLQNSKSQFEETTYKPVRWSEVKAKRSRLVIPASATLKNVVTFHGTGGGFG